MRKGKFLLLALMIPGMIFLLSCGDRELRKDTQPVADAMCRNIEIMNQLRNANPADTAGIRILQENERKVQIEMTVIYNEFKTKYKDKMNDASFNKKFATELRKAMLNCPYLSKEDRDTFEKEID
ncbi:MAG TPA: hypothetical protein VMC08_08550 [Bacteroidales bacterium]|nr:hypothetical protein [Bacteroidales bacterium]